MTRRVCLLGMPCTSRLVHHRSVTFPTTLAAWVASFVAVTSCALLVSGSSLVRHCGKPRDVHPHLCPLMPTDANLVRSELTLVVLPQMALGRGVVRSKVATEPAVEM